MHSRVRGWSMTSPRLLPCPCCSALTICEPAGFEICERCGWEDDGQSDADAHVVRGGPNGPLSLAAARLNYLRTGHCGY
ncbi:CPCC family cysteine-rich protein [Shinella sp. M27]|uniref:CPCC family cysteine-rich protein n=1 Tax=Shinella sp. M27 TaxID=3368614 RepID=UPI003B9E95C0